MAKDSGSHSKFFKSLPLLFLLLVSFTVCFENEEELFSTFQETSQAFSPLLTPTAIESNYTKLSSFDDNIANFIAEDILVDGDYLFVAAGDEGLIIFDIQNASSPKLISQFYEGEAVDGLDVVGDIAYLTVYSAGIQIINISNIYKPEIIGIFDTNVDGLHKIYVEGDYAYVGFNHFSSQGGLMILDITSKAHPYLISQLEIQNIGRIEELIVKDNIALVAGSRSSAFFDFSDKLNIVKTDVNLGYNDIRNMFLDDNILYIAADVFGVIIFDVTNIEAPVYLNKYQNGSNPIDVFVKNDVAYVVSKLLGLLLLDVSDPSTPTFLSNDNRGDFKGEIWIENEFAYVTELDEYLQVYDVSNAQQPELLYNMSTSGFSEEITAYGEYVFIADMLGGVEIINATNKLFPERIAVFSEPNGCISDVVYWNDTLFLADEKYGLVIVNITDMSSPQKITNWTNGGEPRKIAYADGFVYLGDYLQGLEIINVTDLLNPSLVYTYSTSDITDVFVENNVTYISIEDSGFDILNVTSKTSPIVLKSYSDSGSAYSLTIEGNRLYLADGADGLEVYDITDITNPVKLSTGLTIDFAESIFVNNSLLFIAGDFSGLLIVRDNGGSFEVVGEYTETGETRAVFIHHSFIYLADGYGNFQILGKDTDNDGLGDFAEAYYGTNPLLSDTDQDGLSDAVEALLYRTNPLSNDTDSDGMSDYFEVKYGLNPKDASDATIDTDEDGLTNLEEFQHSTNPRDSDTDDDFLTDFEEVNVHFTDPTNPDTDGDGWADSWEIYYQTDPLDPLDYPDFATTPPLTGPTPTNPYGGEFKYYYLAIPVGVIGIAGLVIFLVNRLRKPGTI